MAYPSRTAAVVVSLRGDRVVAEAATLDTVDGVKERAVHASSLIAVRVVADMTAALHVVEDLDGTQLVDATRIEMRGWVLRQLADSLEDAVSIATDDGNDGDDDGDVPVGA